MSTSPLASSDAGAVPGTRYVDLHSHSTASDGTKTPTELVSHAVSAGLHAIALTDHDTIDGLSEAISAAKNSPIRIVAGCELSAYDGSQEIHLLALHITKFEVLQPHLDTFRIQRDDRARKMVEKLARLGLEISFDDVLRESDGGVIGRPHVARALVQHGHVTDLRMAFDKYLAAGRAAYVEKPRLDIAEAIEMTHAAGALAVWAHPAREGTRPRLTALAQRGLDGVEVLHPSHSPADVQRIGDLAADLSLLPSGGSDWHGATEGYRVLGNMCVPGEWLDRQDARVTSRVSV